MQTKILYQVCRYDTKIIGVVEYKLLYRSQLQPKAMLDASNNIVQEYVYADGINVPDYIIGGTTNYKVVTDHLGSVRMVINASTGIVVQQIEYNEFGNVLNDTNPGFQPFGYAGGLYDPDTELVRFGRRDYDPTIG